jgi:hypothetical protein
MHFVTDARGAEMSEVIAGLVAVLAAGIVAINVAMGGLQGGATKIKNWLTAITITAPKTS